LTAAALLFLLQTAPGLSAIFYVATNGVDANTGSSNSPFATIMRAQSAAASGDSVYLRGGTYFLNNSNFTVTNSPWAIVNNITQSGISYLAYPGERPVFDFSNVQPSGLRVTAFLVTANNCVFQGFEVIGVPVTIPTSHTQSECFRIAGGSNNRFQQLSLHDGMANGWYLTSGASNLVLNCDAYNNKGLDSGSIGNTDGFGCHPSKGGKGNIIRGCRAWFNSDDGYDCINAFEAVTFDHCWAFYNGYWTNFTYPGGDGNGFKGGGYGANGTNSPGKPLPVPVPRHLIQFSLAVRNRASGFYSNHHAGGSDWYDNTAYRNSTDYNMLSILSDNLTDVPGYDHVMKNNLGYKGNTEVSNLDTNNSDVSFNFFTLSVTVATNDFLTLDESLLTQPRQANGDLPYIAFARLTNLSDCLDAGTNLGFAFYGAAPDLGAFEFGPTNAPSPTVALFGTNLVFIASGWANTTNYLVASTNLMLPTAQWTRLATNVSDLSGICAFTNAIPPGVPQRFYRIGVP
jgi:pectate lyase